MVVAFLQILLIMIILSLEWSLKLYSMCCIVSEFNFQGSCPYYHLIKFDLTYQHRKSEMLWPCIAASFHWIFLVHVMVVGAAFVVDHAINCCFGSLVTCRSSKVWDAVRDLASLVWNLVRHELIVQEVSDDECGTLIA